MPAIKQVSFTSPYSAEEEEIARRRRMAELMQAKGQEGVGPTEMVGGWAIPKSPMEGLGKAAQQLSGAYQQNRATEMAKQLQARQQGDRTADMGALAAMLQGAPASPGVDDPTAGYSPPTAARPGGQIDPAMLGQLKTPDVQNMAMQMFAQQMQRENAPPERVDLGDRIGLVKDGQIVGYLPKGATPDAALRETGAQQRHLTPSGSAQLGANTTLQTHATPSGSALLTDQRARSEGALSRGQAMSIAQMADQRAREAAAVKPPPATPGQTATDKEFAKEYVAFKASGGIADVKKQLAQLSEAADELEKNPSLTGPYRGLLPDKMRAITNPQAVATKEAVQEVAQRNLRLVLGAQFTEKEGERLIARVYNDQLEPAENAKRVKRLITQIGEAAQAKQSAADYFEKNGTLTGWNGKLYTLSDFMPKDRGSDAGKPEGGWSVVR